MSHVERSELRAAFARSLSEMYGREVPAHTTLVQVAHEVNQDIMRAAGAAAARLGSIERVTGERRGAIRLGTPARPGLSGAGRGTRARRAPCWTPRGRRGRWSAT